MLKLFPSQIAFHRMLLGPGGLVTPAGTHAVTQVHTAPGPDKPWIIFLDPGGADRLHQVGGLQAELQAVRDAVLAADAGLLQPGTVSHLSSVMIS